MQTVSSGTEELSSSIAAIGRRVVSSAEIARKAVDEAVATDAKATDEIRSQIANMQLVTSSAVGAIRSITNNRRDQYAFFCHASQAVACALSAWLAPPLRAMAPARLYFGRIAIVFRLAQRRLGG